MADSYVCSGATMKCSMGTSQAKLTVLPSRTVFLTGQPMANISDHLSMVNLSPFGRCRSLGFPATASATAANHGSLTPMPCMHNTPFPWMGGKNDYIVKGNPALLRSSTCQCMWGGTISLVTDGQMDTGPVDMSRIEIEEFPKVQTRPSKTKKISDMAEKYISEEISKEDFFKKEIIPLKDQEDCWRAVKKARRHKAVLFYNDVWKDDKMKNQQENNKNRLRWIRSCANGIDYNYSVKESPIPPPDTVYRYVLPGETGGSYYFPASSPMPSPEQLGIHSTAIVDGELIEKKIKEFKVNSKMDEHARTCLISTASPVKAPLDGNWKNKAPENMQKTKGGAIQIFVPNNNVIM